ncbi:DENN domain-containing protein 3-like [Montipora foliosa]|uniref:DENN domain-containing protein 3-like n=1 Tax=Montipora foliosa TaxID=591990 RepID=UPI0035F15E0C
MDNPFKKMLNSLIEICVVVGMDQDTGLVPSSSLPKQKNALKGNKTDQRLFSTMFETSVLAAISGETASFPQTQCEVYGEPFYPNHAVLCSPGKRGARGRRGSVMHLHGGPKPTELPLPPEAISSLPPLCFPDGAYVSKKREPVSCHSLILTDIEGNRTYCMAMTFFRGFIYKEDEGCRGKYELFYMDEKGDEKALQGSSLAVCFIPTCCCLISKWPYFNLMKDCLSCLLPQVITSDARSFGLALMRFVSQLAMVPVPPPGSLGIEFELCGVRHLVRPAENPETRVVDIELHYPFLYFSLDDILLLIGCILTQQRIVFLSASYSLLTPIIESFFTFIQPFSWSWTYVPILPSTLLDLVEAPGAFIMGCHAQHKNQIKSVVTQMDEFSSIVIADIDEGQVTLHQDAKIPRLPAYATDLFKFRMKNAKVHFDRVLVQRQTFFNLEELRQEREKFVRNFRQVVLASTLEMMLRMFSDLRTFIIQQEDLFFDMEKFIASKPCEDQDFYSEVCRSHSFSTFLYDLIRDPDKTDYFTLMAQKTRVAPKVAPLRKRSSTTVPIPVPVISDEFFMNTQENLSIFALPPFGSEGIYTGGFYGVYLKSVEEKISDLMAKSSSLVANYLYLRGMLRVACRQSIQAVDDFFLVSSRNVQLFPTKIVQEILCNMKDAELEELRARQYWKKAETLRLQAEEKRDFRRDRKEVLISAIPSTPLTLSDFVKHVSRLLITNSQDAGERLFQALTVNSQVVEPEVFAAFYEAYTMASSKATSISLCNVRLREDEDVLKISQLTKTNQGMGFLVLTINRLLFLENGTHNCSTIVEVEDIRRVDIITCPARLSRGTTNIQITSKRESSLSFVASMKEENEFWRKCLLEIKAGYMMASGFKDPAIIGHAAKNVLMADTLKQCDYPEENVSLVFYFSTQRHVKHQLSVETRKTLFKRVSPSPQDMEKTTVEALLYLPGSKKRREKVWCAMGSSGVIVVIDGVAWEYEKHMIYAKERVSCLLAVGTNQVWAGSMDNTIYVINTHTGEADQQLSGHRDSLSHMIQTQDKQGYNTVWSASSNGQIVGWDPMTLTAKKEIQVKVGRKDEKTLYWFCAVGETFWCATRFSIYVVNYVTDHEGSKVLTPMQDTPMSIDCMCAVSDFQVWAACDKRARIVMWNTLSYEKEHRVLCDCNRKTCTICKCGGFTNMLEVGEEVWVGSKSGIIYVMKKKTVKVVKELNLHEDRIRAMCITDYGFVITGPGSRDGRIAVWKSYLADIPEPKMSKGVCLEETPACEVDGFEMVNRKDMVQFDMDQKHGSFIQDAFY